MSIHRVHQYQPYTTVLVLTGTALVLALILGRMCEFCVLGEYSYLHDTDPSKNKNDRNAAATTSSGFFSPKAIEEAMRKAQEQRKAERDST